MPGAGAMARRTAGARDVAVAKYTEEAEGRRSAEALAEERLESTQTETRPRLDTAEELYIRGVRVEAARRSRHACSTSGPGS